MISFGSRIQQVIREMGISQSEFGRRLGATSQSVNGWCHSGSLPRKELLDKLPEISGKPLFWFFTTEYEEAVFSPLLTSEKLLPESRLTQFSTLFMQLEEQQQNHLLEHLKTLNTDNA